MSYWVTLRRLLGVCLMAGSGGGALAQAPPEPIAPPGEGVMCSFAIASAMAEVGRVCFPGQDAEYQSALQYSAARLESFVITNAPAHAADIPMFKRNQAHVGAPKEQVCQDTALQMYTFMRDQTSPDELRRRADAAVAQPGEPTWGTCL